MYEFGDELSFRIPWLIWIQVLVFFLLFFLLYSFSLITSDLSHTPTSSPSSPSRDSSGFDIKLCNTSALTLNRLRHTRVGDNRSIKGEIATSTGRRIVAENNIEGQSPHIGFHLCDYFRLAFLKCLGLDSSSENSSPSERKKDR